MSKLNDTHDTQRCEFKLRTLKLSTYFLKSVMGSIPLNINVFCIHKNFRHCMPLAREILLKNQFYIGMNTSFLDYAFRDKVIFKHYVVSLQHKALQKPRKRRGRRSLMCTYGIPSMFSENRNESLC